MPLTCTSTTRCTSPNHLWCLNRRLKCFFSSGCRWYHSFTRFLHYEAVTNWISFSTFGREIIGIFEALRHFRPMADGLQLTIFTDHKLLTWKLLSSSAKYLDRKICQLENVCQCTLDIWLLAGKNNMVADALSRLKIYAIADLPNLFFEAMAAAQENDVELHNMSSSHKAL